MSCPYLSPELNEIVRKGTNSDWTINLQEVEVGNIVVVEFGNGEEKRSIHFRIDQVAGPGWGDDVAKCTIVGGTFPQDLCDIFTEANLSFPPINQECTIIGACTKNPGAPMGMTMIHMHRISIGRHLCWHTKYDEKDNTQWIFDQPVSSWQVLKPKNK